MASRRAGRRRIDEERAFLGVSRSSASLHLGVSTSRACLCTLGRARGRRESQKIKTDASSSSSSSFIPPVPSRTTRPHAIHWIHLALRYPTV